MLIRSNRNTTLDGRRWRHGHIVEVADHDVDALIPHITNGVLEIVDDSPAPTTPEPEPEPVMLDIVDDPAAVEPPAVPDPVVETPPAPPAAPRVSGLGS